MDGVKNYLRGLEEEENVKILFAVDAGSRSTSLESEKSDFDVMRLFQCILKHSFLSFSGSFRLCWM